MRVDRDRELDYLEGTTPIGFDVSIKFCTDRNGAVVGIEEMHRDSSGFLCVGAVMFVIPGVVERGQGSGSVWDVVQREPLTLTPSILCKSCGKHGYIRNGAWVPA